MLSANPESLPPPVRDLEVKSDSDIDDFIFDSAELLNDQDNTPKQVVQ